MISSRPRLKSQLFRSSPWNSRNYMKNMVRPERFELSTFWFAPKADSIHCACGSENVFEFLSAAARFQKPLSLHGFRSRRETFLINQVPWPAISRRRCDAMVVLS